MSRKGAQFIANGLYIRHVLETLKMNGQRPGCLDDRLCFSDSLLSVNCFPTFLMTICTAFRAQRRETHVRQITTAIRQNGSLEGNHIKERNMGNIYSVAFLIGRILIGGFFISAGFNHLARSI